MEISSTFKKNPNKTAKSTGKIVIKASSVKNWQSKQLKCECFNELRNFEANAVSDSKPISVNCS